MFFFFLCYTLNVKIYALYCPQTLSRIKSYHFRDFDNLKNCVINGTRTIFVYLKKKEVWKFLMVVKITLLASTITGVFFIMLSVTVIIVVLKKWFRGSFYFWKPPHNSLCLIITKCKQIVKCQLRKNVKPVTFFFIQAYYIVIDGWNSGIILE